MIQMIRGLNTSNIDRFMNVAINNNNRTMFWRIYEWAADAIPNYWSNIRKRRYFNKFLRQGGTNMIYDFSAKNDGSCEKILVLFCRFVVTWDDEVHQPIWEALRNSFRVGNGQHFWGNSESSVRAAGDLIFSMVSVSQWGDLSVVTKLTSRMLQRQKMKSARVLQYLRSKRVPLQWRGQLQTAIRMMTVQ